MKAFEKRDPNSIKYKTKDLCVVRMHYTTKTYIPGDVIIENVPTDDLTLLAVRNEDGTFTLVSSGEVVRGDDGKRILTTNPTKDTIFAVVETEKTKALINSNKSKITHTEAQKYEANLNPHKNPDNLFIITATDGRSIVVYKQDDKLIYDPMHPIFRPFTAELNADGLYELSTGGKLNPLKLVKLTDKYPEIASCDGDNPFMANLSTLTNVEHELLDLKFKQAPPATEAVVDASTTNTEKMEQNKQNPYEFSKEVTEIDPNTQKGNGHDANTNDDDLVK